MHFIFSRVVIIILIGTCVFSSGCFSATQKENITKPTLLSPHSSLIHSIGTTSPRYWIRIDPIPDFKTDATFNITGSTMLNVTGTTNSPPGTILHATLVEWSKNRMLVEKDIVITGNDSGPNPFFLEYDMAGKLPGRYTVTLQPLPNTNHLFEDFTFSITSDTPYLKWIQVDHLGKVQSGGILPVSGTTNLPVGSEIMLQAKIDGHSCTMATPDELGERTLCGGSCGNTGSKEIIHVAVGADGINIWNSAVNTTDWCLGEGYVIGASAVNWTNVSPGSQYFRF